MCRNDASELAIRASKVLWEPRLGVIEIEVVIMNRSSAETVGVRFTGWAALNRDPLEDTVEYTCPHCGTRGTKAARRPRSEYHFTDGFVQDLQGEMSRCAGCKRSLRVSPVVLLHDRDEQRRFNAVFLLDAEISKN
jgi:hypothetical protein